MKSRNLKSPRSRSSRKPRSEPKISVHGGSSIDFIKQLIARGAAKEAKEAFGEYLKNIKVSSVEAGALYAEIALLYMRVNRMILESYGDFQQDVIKELKDLNIKERILTQ